MAVTITVHEVPATHPTAPDVVSAIRARARAFPPFDASRVARDLDADRR
ncbi:hypothetical protein [Cellulomonas fimi]|nr:hypothetical protein [Cellulomonas fimi]